MVVSLKPSLKALFKIFKIFKFKIFKSKNSSRNSKHKPYESLYCQYTLQDENIHRILFSDPAQIGQIHGVKY